MEYISALRAPFDDHKPSLFELLGEQQLSALLPPTLRYLLATATQHHPRYLLRALNSFDELYALVSLVVEYHYLRTRGGTFTENFYGLKRERAPISRGLHTTPHTSRAAIAAPALASEALALRPRDIARNLAAAVLLPYLKRKLDDAYEAEAPRALLGLAYNRLPESPTVRQRLAYYARWFLRHIYPSVHAAYSFATVVCHLAYLFDRSSFYSPALWLVDTRVRRLTAADQRRIDALVSGGGGGGGGYTGRWGPLRAMALRLPSSLSVVLPASIFALKFLEWWHTSELSKQLTRKTADSLALPVPTVAGLDGKGMVVNASAAAAAAAAAAVEPVAADPMTAEPAAAPSYPCDATAPIATPSMLPILTVPLPADSALCPICEREIATATACQTGVVYCYTCIHRWIDGVHPRQDAFITPDKVGRWDCGKGRCAVTGQRVLGATDGLRRIII